jgi:hypothetical protein
MTPTEAILAHVNDKVPRDATFRAILGHTGWWVPRPVGATLPTIIVTDINAPVTIWAFSSDAAYQAACAKHHKEAIGDISVVGHLDDVLVEDDPRVQRLMIDPESPIAFEIKTDALAAFRKLARAVRVERAMTEGDYATVRKFGAYFVPYFGVLGQGHNIITVGSPKGSMVAAFTSVDQAEAFLATGSAEQRAKVNWIQVDGDQLFGVVQDIAQGVIINFAGPRPFGFELATCQDIAKAT